MSEYPATDAINEAIREAMDPTYGDFIEILDDILNDIWQAQNDLESSGVYSPSLLSTVGSLRDAEERVKKLDEMLFERFGRYE